ncbi:MAG TPA: hypothetical protein VIK72_15020 [Clostridiaceae bacterium]
MPKLCKSRIINLNYNDGKRSIYNEIFDYGQGKDTLFSMDNGIGKTVLIQFFLQPFIRNKRDLAGRRFEDYFTGSSPTYIIHEVLLDNGEKLLVGMVIKKENTEEEKNKVRILAFINKYNRPNEFDIINIPFVEGKRILKFSEAEDKIKKYKSGRVNFKYYNFNDSSKKNEYFEDLKTYKIDYKEWEDIIRSINNDESGLSNLYDKHKTDEALLRNVIIPLIESKINGEKNIMTSIRNNLGKYIESYKESKEAFNEVDLLKAFTSDMTSVTELLKEGTEKEEIRSKAYSWLSSISMLSDEEFAKKCREKLQCEEFIIELKEELKNISYQEHSLSYYKFEAEEKLAEEKLKEISETWIAKDGKLKAFVKEKYIEESAEAYEDLALVQGNLAEVRERIANYEKEDSEIALNIKNYKFTLRKIYEEELLEHKGKEAQLSKQEESLKAGLISNEKEQESSKVEARRNISLEEAAKNKINNFDGLERKYIKKYKDFNFLMNPILEEYNAKDLVEHRSNIDTKINSNITKREKLKADAHGLISERENIRVKLETTGIETNEHNITLTKKRKDLEIFNKATAKIVEILTVKNLPIKVALFREKLREILQSDNSKLQETLVKEADKLREIVETINRYETGLIQLPKEVVESFENKGISFEYALNFLQNYKGSKEEKESLVSSNPFFPYGILLSRKDIDLLKSESLDVYTSIPIPIINKSDLSRGLVNSKNNDILTFENQDFLIAFNYLLIDEEKRIELINDLRLEAHNLKEEIKKLESAMDRNKEYAVILASYPYKGDEAEALQGELHSIEDFIKVLETSLANLKEAAYHNEESRESNRKELHELEGLHLELIEQQDKFTEFLLAHEEYKRYNNSLLKLKKAMEELKKRELKLTEEQKELNATLYALTINFHELKGLIKESTSKFEAYRNILEGALLGEDKNLIEAKLLACEKQLGDDLKRDKVDEKKYKENLRRVQDRLGRIVKDGALLQEYKEISFSEEHLEELKDNIKSLEKITKEIKDEMTRVDKQLDLIIYRKNSSLKEIEKLGFDAAIEKEAIKDSNFKAREKKIKEDLSENDKIIKEYIVEIDKLKALKLRLENYKSYSKDEFEVNFDFSNLDLAIKAINENISQYEAMRREVYTIESKITKVINTIHDNYRDKNRFIKERLFDYLNKERKIQSSSDIESLLEVVDRKVRTIEVELSHIKAEEEIVINEILRYANHVLQELKTIDKKSSIKHLGKTQKLLEIVIPEEKEEEALREYIKAKVGFYSSMEEDYQGLLEGDIQSAELLSKLIGNINRIRVDIKKIEKSGLVRKSWKEALSHNSGGEKFVSMFILLSSLMSYMRKRETDIDNKEEKKILIMDNPFAKTNAEHLLEPMFQIAEKYNIQLLCFSGIGGSSVYNKFDKIYVAKVVEDKFRNKENVSFKSGSEETLELTDFNISREQLSLF